MRINITLSEELVSKIDERARAMYISRSAYIATALTQKMQADDAMTMLPELSKAMNDAIKLQREKAPYMDSTVLGAEIEEAKAELDG